MFTYYLLFSKLYIMFFFTKYIDFLNNNVTCHLSEKKFSLMWTFYGASKGLFY
ncbi:unnamed protein product [Brassica oleracea]